MTSTSIPSTPKGAAGIDRAEVCPDSQDHGLGQGSLIDMEQPPEGEKAVGVDRADHAGGLQEDSDDVARGPDQVGDVEPGAFVGHKAALTRILGPIPELPTVTSVASATGDDDAHATVMGQFSSIYDKAPSTERPHRGAGGADPGRELVLIGPGPAAEDVAQGLVGAPPRGRAAEHRAGGRIVIGRPVVTGRRWPGWPGAPGRGGGRGAGRPG